MSHQRGSMMRSMALPFALLLGACTVGEAPNTGRDGGGSGAAERDTCETRVAAPPPPYMHSSAPTGPRAGTACMDAGCHGNNSGRDFAFAGTVYKETAAVTPATGVTVRIYELGAPTPLAEAVTDMAGNFRIGNPAMFAAFPYETHVTACGPQINIRPMVGQISKAEANCSTGGSCHGTGGTQGAVFFSD
jgi:hypothetical protein